MVPVLTSLIALQTLDSAAEAARRRLGELPAAEQALARQQAVAAAEVEAAKARLAENQRQRREFEKQVATVDTRLAQFDKHKAAVKTNQEFTALLHEIETAKAEKDGIEEQILGLMESADGVAAEVKAAEAALATVRREGETALAALRAEQTRLRAEIDRLTAEKTTQAAGVDRVVLAKYEQLLKQRKMVAIAPMQGELCTACHVRLRPAVTQQVRRNAEIIQCDSCQRILYFVPPAAAAEPAEASAS